VDAVGSLITAADLFLSSTVSAMNQEAYMRQSGGGSLAVA
jgi:hypothetical protein